MVQRRSGLGVCREPWTLIQTGVPVPQGGAHEGLGSMKQLERLQRTVVL